jgi:hypothetical protein
VSIPILPRIPNVPKYAFTDTHLVLLVPVLAFATVTLARRWDYGALNLYFTQYGRVRTAEPLHGKHERGAGAAV